MNDIQKDDLSYSKLTNIFKNEIKNISPLMEKAMSKLSMTRTPEGQIEAKRDLLYGCFENANKIKEIVLSALNLVAEVLRSDRPKSETNEHRAIAIHYAMNEEGNMFSVHRLIQSSSHPDFDCFIALKLAIEKHDIPFINSVLFPEGSGRLPHLKIDSRNRIAVALQFCAEKGDYELVQHIITKVPVAHRSFFYSMVLCEAFRIQNEILSSFLLSNKDSFKINDEAIHYSENLLSKYI